MEKIKVLDIYRKMLKRANQLHERSINLQDTIQVSKVEVDRFCANELYYWSAELEKTEEVNPTK